MPPADSHLMPTAAQIFRLLNEMVLVLLGALLIPMAISGHHAVPGRSGTWIGLSTVVIFWGVRAWMRQDRSASRRHTSLRGGSLALVGAIVLGIAWLPFHYIAPLLGIAGSILALRGLASALLFTRTP